MAMKSDSTLGIVLLQLGGPDSLDSVEPFLYNLFSDPDIIDLPLAFLFRRGLARLISRRRAPKVQEYYKRIGRRSPILKLTIRQAKALERELGDSLNAKVYVGMRYWHPMTEEVIHQLHRDGIKRVLLLPLYPHFSKTTTGSSVNEWKRVVAQQGMNNFQVDLVEEYCEHPLYIRSVVRNIAIALRRVPERDRGKVHLVFSAHGTPVKLAQSGDPYQQQIIRTYHAVVAEGRFGLDHHLCYQSKVGPERWLEPSLETTINELAGNNVSHVLVIPIAFVSDHSETLWEINIQVKEEAKKLGIRYYDMSPALNTNPLFIQALADLVRKKVA
ncbi:MAG: ferrochelatase [Ignavibacteria bacterium]|nr:ferrochelatase [Ignavibacteria bacterium]